LIIDPDGKLTLAICSKCFQAVAGWHAKITQHPRLIQKAQLSQDDILDFRRQLSASTPGPDQLRFGIGKALNHGDRYNASRYTLQVGRLVRLGFWP
jgi:hypothetical protein